MAKGPLWEWRFWRKWRRNPLPPHKNIRQTLANFLLFRQCVHFCTYFNFFQKRHGSSSLRALYMFIWKIVILLDLLIYCNKVNPWTGIKDCLITGYAVIEWSDSVRANQRALRISNLVVFLKQVQVWCIKEQTIHVRRGLQVSYLHGVPDLRWICFNFSFFAKVQTGVNFLMFFIWLKKWKSLKTR